MCRTQTVPRGAPGGPCHGWRSRETEGRGKSPGMTHDVIVIGSGQAGVPLSKRLAAAGKRVLLVERRDLGGTCVNTGCTPSKTMIASARAAHVARGAARLGVRAGPVSVDLAEVVARKEAVVARWRRGLQASLEEVGERLELRRGHARFVGPREIEVEGRRYAAGTVVLNTGARAAVPDLPGLASVPWLGNRRLMELRRAPQHLAILGGGYVGCELGQAFRRFGSEVTIVDHNPRLLARLDEDLSAALEGAFRAEGIRLELSARVESVAGREGQVTLQLGGGREVRASHLLVAAGRRPNTDDLGCGEAGIELDRQGYIRVDDRYQ